MITYPRIELIPIPKDINPQYVGKYITAKAHEFLQEVMGQIVPRTITISAVSAEVFILRYETQSSYSLPKTLDIKRYNTEQSKPVESNEISPRFEAGLNHPLAYKTTRKS